MSCQSKSNCSAITWHKLQQKLHTKKKYQIITFVSSHFWRTCYKCPGKLILADSIDLISKVFTWSNAFLNLTDYLRHLVKQFDILIKRLRSILCNFLTGSSVKLLTTEKCSFTVLITVKTRSRAVKGLLHNS